MAGGEFSFDIVSKVNLMEAKNAMDQVAREVANRYDFRGLKADATLEKEEIKLHAEDDFRLQQLRDIVLSKLVKRGIDLKMVEHGKPESGAGASMRQTLKLKAGLSMDEAKALVKQIKENKALKVNCQVQGDAVRVSSKSKDDLQKCISFVKGLDLPYAVEFTNYR